MKILVLAPHTDDGELGCGGTVARFAMEQQEVHYVAFSAAEKSVKPEFPSDILRKEVVAATSTLGIKPAHLHVLHFDVRDFPTHRQAILQSMIDLRDELNPALVFIPCTSDTHQDHQTISSEGFRAFKSTTILGYELPWSNMSFTASAFVTLNEEQVSRKVMALKEYKSQADRPYATADFVRALASVRGTQIGVKYAEAFESIRWIMK